MKVLVLPNSFKDILSTQAVCIVKSVLEISGFKELLSQANRVFIGDGKNAIVQGISTASFFRNLEPNQNQLEEFGLSFNASSINKPINLQQANLTSQPNIQLLAWKIIKLFNS